MTSWMLYVPSAFRVSAMRGRVTLIASSTGAQRHSEVADTSTASSSNSSSEGPGARSASLKSVIVARSANGSNATLPIVASRPNSSRSSDCTLDLARGGTAR